ncbi:hypothetical protein [Thalassobacillus hwangdonensis]|uniref:Uncharacterized protein n=1 Tax=Thalassobacillus hwangdonensis TaxID=546108 RepID=A0ABW3KZJ7_9BACI
MMVVMKTMQDLQTLIETSNYMNYEIKDETAHIFKDTSINEERYLLAIATYFPHIHCLQITSYDETFEADRITSNLDVNKLETEDVEDGNVYKIYLK